MSAEVVKKRGRPKKVVTEIAEVELPELVKKPTTRAKSTKTVLAKPVKEITKTAKAKTTTTAKSTTKSTKPALAESTAKSSPALSKAKTAESVMTEAVPSVVSSPPQSPSKIPSPTVNTRVEPQPQTATNPSAKPLSEASPKPEAIVGKAAAEATQKPKLKPFAITKPPIPNPTANNKSRSPIAATKIQSQSQPPPTSATTVLGSPVTPATSKILSKVRELSQKPTGPSIQQPPAAANGPSTTTIPKPAVLSATPAKPYTPPPTLETAPQMPPLSQPKPTPKKAYKKIPIVEFNKEVVSNITARAGARPNPAGSTGLPPNYRATARKVTLAIVAAPIAIVTSYVLYQRLILGEDQKHLVRPGLTTVETSGSQEASLNTDLKSI